MKAINPKNQGKLNKAIKALIKYNELNDLRERADNEGDQKEFGKLQTLCLKQWNKFRDFVSDLPKGEQKRIEESKLY